MLAPVPVRAWPCRFRAWVAVWLPRLSPAGAGFTSTQPPVPAKYQKPVPAPPPAVPSVWYTISPCGGVAMAPRWAAVRRGMSRPWVVEVRSSTALGLGVGVPMPTLWARPARPSSSRAQRRRKAKTFFITSCVVRAAEVIFLRVALPA